jgi:hypothetical protein
VPRDRDGSLQRRISVREGAAGGAGRFRPAEDML